MLNIGDEVKLLIAQQDLTVGNKYVITELAQDEHIRIVDDQGVSNIYASKYFKKTWSRQPKTKDLDQYAETPEVQTEPIKPESTHDVEQLEDLASKLMNYTLSQGQKLAKKLVKDLQDEILEVKSQAQNKILAVKINDTETKELSTQAVPYLKRMIISAKLGKNIMLIGPAGCGKTTAAEQLAESLGVPFHNLTFTAGASETWLFGRQTPTGFVAGSFWLAYRDGGVFLADEFDAGDANLILSINTAIENGHCFNPINGENVKRHKDFVFIAACNTFGKGADATYTGRNRLDAASLRRFAGSMIAVTYNLDIERVVCPDENLRTTLQTARTNLANVSSTEIVSTGCLKNAYDLYSNGVSYKEIRESLTLSWPDDLKKLMPTKLSKSNDEIPF